MAGQNRVPRITAFPDRALAVVLDTNFDEPSTIYVGTTGNVSVVLWNGGNTVVFTAVPAGQMVPARVKQVTTANTTASNLVRVY